MQEECYSAAPILASAKARKEKQQQAQQPGLATTDTGNGVGRAEEADAPATKAFMIELFATIKEDIQGLRAQLAAELRDVRRDVDELGERVATMEEHNVDREESLHQLQQELLRLREQNLDLQTHAEDLENRSRRNNIRIRAVPWKAEGEDLREYVGSLFQQILGEEETSVVQMDRVHRVGLPRGKNAPPPDILVCIHDFQIKERILRRARDQQPLLFRDHHPALYEDLAASTLAKRRDFKPVTTYLKEENIPYSWGHPFCLIFKHNGKLVQISSLVKAQTLLGIQAESDDTDSAQAHREKQRSSPGWQRVGSGPSTSKPDQKTSQREREAALSSVLQVTDRSAAP